MSDAPERASVEERLDQHAALIGSLQEDRPNGNVDNRYLCDHQGHKSSIRVNSLICLVMACFIAIVDVLGYGPGSSDMLPLTITFLSASFGPKVLQAGLERVGK